MTIHNIHYVNLLFHEHYCCYVTFSVIVHKAVTLKYQLKVHLELKQSTSSAYCHWFLEIHVGTSYDNDDNDIYYLKKNI